MNEGINLLSQGMDWVVLGSLLEDEIAKANHAPLEWEMEIPLADTEDIKYNGAKLIITFSEEALFYQKSAPRVDIRSSKLPSILDFDPNEEDFSDYGANLSDEIKEIIRNASKDGSEDEEDWTTVSASIIGSIKRDSIESVQCNMIGLSLYRISVSNPSSSVSLILDDAEKASLFTTLLEYYRDYPNFIKIAARIQADILEEHFKILESNA